jgi:hypothetical protein
VMYNSYKVLKGRSIWISANFSTIANDISMSSVVDAFGKRVNTPINTSGNYNWNLYSDWNRYPGNKKMNYSIGAASNGGRNVGYTNNEKSINDYRTVGGHVSIGYYSEEKWNFDLRPEISFTTSVSSLQPQNKTSYYTSTTRLSFYRALSKKWDFSTDAEINLRQKISASDINTNAAIWNAVLTRKLFKKDAGKISLVANDILDQNKGYNRVINSNFIRDERYLQVSRYVMLRLEWSFNKSAGNEK